MTTAVPLTLQLLILIGLYELAAGLAGLTGRINWTTMLDEFERSPGLTFVTGFAVFAVGAAISLAHNHWTDVAAGIVSAIGWIAVAEGLLIMVAARPLLSVSRKLVTNQKAVSILALIFGAVLILIGLTGRADPTII